MLYDNNDGPIYSVLNGKPQCYYCCNGAATPNPGTVAAGFMGGGCQSGSTEGLSQEDLAYQEGFCEGASGGTFFGPRNCIAGNFFYSPCSPCTAPQTELGWSYQGYPTWTACEAAGQTYCCECINTG